MTRPPTPGSRLPSLTLPDALSGVRTRLRSGRGALVLLALHSPTCGGCIALVEGLGDIADRVREWGGRIVVIVPGDPGHGKQDAAADRLRRAVGKGNVVLADPEGKVASGSAVTIAVADEWGEVYFGEEGGGDHALATPEELLEWVRFVTIQCPECEGPEGEWLKLAGQ